MLWNTTYMMMRYNHDKSTHNNIHQHNTIQHNIAIHQHITKTQHRLQLICNTTDRTMIDIQHNTTRTTTTQHATKQNKTKQNERVGYYIVYAD